MPPQTSADDYVDLVTAIEDTAAHLEMPVVIEGYPPPDDPRLRQIKVTPDPGVIEVNVHPVANWQELVSNTTALYDDARQSRLGAEKFMLDGRHTGTGGGNHFVLGGPTAADSPFLRRPDLLRSMIAYWLNHPSLSYAFSTIFIGPTSQAPRVDETREDSLYELEIAFSLIPGPDQGSVPPWLVDRILRHILVDVTGNTHRAEFCIDKLYSPDSATGRLGLLELRGFEMPPHGRMSLTQQLLVRGLISWFWKEPYTERPIHWGTRLHDQFMLPHFAGQDFRGVLRDLNHAGYEFEAEWFAPHFEFRYPVFGHAHHAGIDIEVRQATEPWYVLGEEGSPGGTARYVDSSVERLQIKVEGLVEGRYRDRVQRPAFASAFHRQARRVGGWRAVSRLAAGLVPASDHSRAFAADVRCRGYLDRAIDRWLLVSRVASGWPQLRYVPGECERSGSATGLALFPVRTHRRSHACASRRG